MAAALQARKQASSELRRAGRAPRRPPDPRQSNPSQEALALVRKVLEIDENFPLALSTLGAVCAQQGRVEEALALTESGRTPRCRGRTWSSDNLQRCWFEADQRAARRHCFTARSPRRVRSANRARGVSRVVWGISIGSVDWAERAIEERYPPVVAILRPLLQSSPRWPALAKLMSLPG